MFSISTSQMPLGHRDADGLGEVVPRNGMSDNEGCVGEPPGNARTAKSKDENANERPKSPRSEKTEIREPLMSHTTTESPCTTDIRTGPRNSPGPSPSLPNVRMC